VEPSGIGEDVRRLLFGGEFLHNTLIIILQ
jgi:hypothetical protein